MEIPVQELVAGLYAKLREPYGRRDFAVRRKWLLMFLVISLGSLVAQQPSCKKEPAFVAPGFQFSQVDAVCIAHPIDLRADKTEQIYLSGVDPAPNVKFQSQPVDWTHSIRPSLVLDFNKRGYETAICNPVNATLVDLKEAKEAWIRKVDFGESRWLFVLAVEEAGSTSGVASGWVLGQFTGGRGNGVAVVSGYLFDKQSNSLVWSDRAGCQLRKGVFGGSTHIIGDKGAVEFIERQSVIRESSLLLIDAFEKRKTKVKYQPSPLY